MSSLGAAPPPPTPSSSGKKKEEAVPPPPPPALPPAKETKSTLRLYRSVLRSVGCCEPGGSFVRREKRGICRTSHDAAVSRLPWWDRTAGGRDLTASYDALLGRLWHGAHAAMIVAPSSATGDDGAGDSSAPSPSPSSSSLPTPPPPSVPHEGWVSLLGFQEPDPKSDFRSAGLLGLACLVHVAESRPDVVRRFVRAAPPENDDDGDDEPASSALPFATSSLNASDWIANDVLLLRPPRNADGSNDGVSRKNAERWYDVDDVPPREYWTKFEDPAGVLELHASAMEALADAAEELAEERRNGPATTTMAAPPPGVELEMTEVKPAERPTEGGDDGATGAGNGNSNDREESRPGKVTAFDFPQLMERTKRRVVEGFLLAPPSRGGPGDI